MNILKLYPQVTLLEEVGVADCNTDSMRNQGSAEISAILKDCAKDGYLDAEQLCNELFPLSAHRVFISHSSRDKHIAQALSHELQQHGFSSFIDSDVWNNVYKVLIKYQFPNNEKTIPADLANRKSKHLYLMLAGALTKMIARCPYFVYIVPSHATVIDHTIKSDSPWLAHELAVAEILYHRQGHIKSAMVNESDALPILHDISASFIPKANTANTIQGIRKLIQKFEM